MTQDKQELQELYCYGYKLLVLQASNLVVVTVIGLTYSCLMELLLFLIAYIPLRSYAGGYHASGPIRCGLISAALELAVAIVLQLSITAGWLNVLLLVTALSEIVIYVNVPVAAKNKPLTDSQVISFRKKARSILGVETVIIVIMYLTGLHRILPVIAMCHIFVAALLLIGKGRETK